MSDYSILWHRLDQPGHEATSVMFSDVASSAPTTLKIGVGKRRDFTDTSLFKEVFHEQEVYRPTFN